MEDRIEDIFSRVCELYSSFCDPNNPTNLKREYDLYIQNLENEILIRRNKEEDFQIRNHEEVMSLVEKYPLDVLRSLNESQVHDLAKKFSELLRASLFVYPTSPEFRQETKLVKQKIAESYYPHRKGFS